MAPDFPLSFGIEVEVIVFTIKTFGDECLLTAGPGIGRTPRRQIQEILEANGLSTYSLDQGGQYNKWAIVNDWSVLIEDDDLKQLAETGDIASIVDGMSDNLEQASQVPLNLRTRIEYEPIEFISPILLFNEEGFAEVKKFMKVLHEHIPAAVNSSCGLHVHVGHLGGAGYTLQDVKRILQVMILGEFQLTQLSGSDRAFNSAYCELNSRAFREEQRQDPPRIFDFINECLSIEEVVDNATISWHSFTRYKYWACNLVPLEYADPEHRTVEFRTHEGTVDTGRVVAWVDFCCSLVSRCKSSASMDFLRNLTPDVSVADFLGMLDLGRFADGRLLIRNHSLQEYLYSRDFALVEEDVEALPSVNVDDDDDQLVHPFAPVLPPS